MSDIKRFTVNIVSPERLIYSGETTYLSVPGSDGILGILPRHSPLMSSIACGVLGIYENDTETRSDEFIVSGGFLEVSSDNCTVLADFAVNKNDIQREEYALRLENLHAEIKHTSESARSVLLTEIAFLKQALSS